MKNNKILTSAGCFVTRKNGEIKELLLMHRVWPNGEEGWILPKGTLEANETLEQCALRETIEETGYTDIEIIKKLNVESYFHPKHKVQKEVHWYLAVAKSSKQQAPEHTLIESDSEINIYWKSFDEALKLLTFEENKKTLKGIINNL